LEPVPHGKKSALQGAKMLIRNARPGDLDAILDIWREHMDFHRERNEFFTRSADGHVRFAEFVLKNMRNPDWLVLVAVSDEVVVGYAMAAIMDYPPVFEIKKYGFIQDAAVSRAYRRRGIGTKLFEGMRGWFGKRGVVRMELQALSNNEISQSFWRKMGFTDYLTRLWRGV
jgi:ribosomal protein S18 acetylase RimI-like enzyme